jgi:long-chain acyl-CoA synthetase
MNQWTVDAEYAFFTDLYQKAYHKGALVYLGRLLERAAHCYSTRTALIYKNEELSYQHLYLQACAISALLQHAGIKPRDRVIVCIENSVDFYRAYFGILQIGAIVVPLNTFLQDNELKHIVEEAEPVALFCDEAKKERFTAITADQKNPILLYTPTDINEAVANNSSDIVHTDLDQHEMVALLYTSGTTGVPKGVMLSSHNIIMNVIQGLARLQYSSYERIFAALPLFHSFAQLANIWGAFFMGCTVIVVPRIERRFIMEGLRHKPTFFVGVPALYGLLCLLRKLDLDSVKYFICGGDMLPDRIRQAFALVYQRKLCNGYGLTEASPVVAADFDDALTVLGTVGVPCIRVDCQIRDDQNAIITEIGRAGAGRLWISGPNIMLGYYKAAEFTATVLKDGWFNTGDLAYRTADGKLVICGREKELIINKGLKIYPAEVENVIAQHPNVIAVGVIGITNTSNNEIPIAFVQLRTDDPETITQIKELCEQYIARYKIPRHFICSTKQLILTATGKINKKALRMQSAELVKTDEVLQRVVQATSDK